MVRGGIKSRNTSRGRIVRGHDEMASAFSSVVSRVAWRAIRRPRDDDNGGGDDDYNDDRTLTG